MGHYADVFSHKTEKEQQKVYLNTGPHPPFARKCWSLGDELGVARKSTVRNTFLQKSNGERDAQNNIWSFIYVRNME